MSGFRPWSRGWWLSPPDRAPEPETATRRVEYVIFLAVSVATWVVFYEILPRLGVHWFFDNFRVGGWLPIPLSLALAAWWMSRRWP